MSDFGLDYRVPAADLSPFVSVFYHWRSAAPRFDDIERAEHPQWRFLLSPAAAGYRFPDGTIAAAPPIHVIGATAGELGVWADGPVALFGMGLTSAGWRLLVGDDTSAGERVIDAASAATAATLAALEQAADLSAMVAVAEPLLRALLVPDGHGAALRFAAEVDAWLAEAASPDCAELTRRAGLSRRQVERRCKALYGMSPKLLARRHRALRAAVAIAARSEGADQLIADGFYDQSHLIREIKRFTGWTPREVRERPGALAQLAVARRRATGR